MASWSDGPLRLNTPYPRTLWLCSAARDEDRKDQCRWICADKVDVRPFVVRAHSAESRSNAVANAETVEDSRQNRTVVRPTTDTSAAWSAAFTNTHTYTDIHACTPQIGKTGQQMAGQCCCAKKKKKPNSQRRKKGYNAVRHPSHRIPMSYGSARIQAQPRRAKNARRQPNAMAMAVFPLRGATESLQMVMPILQLLLLLLAFIRPLAIPRAAPRRMRRWLLLWRCRRFASLLSVHIAY